MTSEVTTGLLYRGTLRNDRLMTWTRNSVRDAGPNGDRCLVGKISVDYCHWGVMKL